MTQQPLLGISPGWLPTLGNFVAGGNVELLSALHHALVGQGAHWGSSQSTPAALCRVRLQ